ncbi:MAG: flagellar hook protein FlgE, partial [gamma proteobacterium symbiont of Bathyaustriella thionipta]|nr:flagellar hook protein FlgE [gamma proteobacterium symbiont of Bathyaustriella thionipta]
MPFRIGLSGLNAAQADLKVTGNNIANVGTVGFKQSRAEFADVYATSKFGSASTAIGSGVRLADTAQQFTQGNIIFTENNLDLGITGDGFFTMDDVSGNRVYTRNGQFKVDRDGFIVDNSGSNLKGYGVDAVTNNINTGSIVDLQIISTNIAPSATSTADLFANIDAGAADLTAPTAIDPLDPTSYHHTTSFTAYDSLGNPMLTSLFFQKNDAALRTWDIGVQLTDSSGTVSDNFAAPETINFDTIGGLNSGSTGNGDGTFDFSAALGSGATSPQVITIDLSNITQYGADFGVTNLTQNGFTTGQLSGIDVDQSGVITARFTNGQSNNLGQVFITNFNNNQGLTQLVPKHINFDRLTFHMPDSTYFGHH